MLKYILYNTKIFFLSLLKSIGIILFAGFIFFKTGTIISVFRIGGRVADILNISSVPNSLQVLKCKNAPFLTSDILVTCQINISVKEFPQLLKGYSYRRLPESTSSYEVAGYKKGSKFYIKEEFVAEPPKFTDGGSVQIYPNPSHTKAIIHYYVE